MYKQRSSIYSQHTLPLCSSNQPTHTVITFSRSVHVHIHVHIAGFVSPLSHEKWQVLKNGLLYEHKSAKVIYVEAEHLITVLILCTYK